MTDLEQEAKAAVDAELAKETAKAKTWFAANREQAIVIACTALAVGLMFGAMIGHIAKCAHP